MALDRTDALVTRGTHITVTMEFPNPAAKTSAWWVCSKYDNAPLGRIKWFSRWRKYAFFPAPDCVFEQVCMRELSQFIEEETAAHLRLRKVKRARPAREQP